jgi:hypothetical protein
VSSGWVDVSYHLLPLIGGDEGWIPQSPRFTNGLVHVGTEAGGAVIYTGVAAGFVQVELRAFQTRPPLDLTSWDEVVEVSIAIPGDTLAAPNLWTEDDRQSPEPLSLASGDYRMRCHALGRDVAFDAAVRKSKEKYLIKVWPESPSREVIHAHKDDVGRNLRRAYSL